MSTGWNDVPTLLPVEFVITSSVNDCRRCKRSDTTRTTPPFPSNFIRERSSSTSRPNIRPEGDGRQRPGLRDDKISHENLNVPSLFECFGFIFISTPVPQSYLPLMKSIPSYVGHHMPSTEQRRTLSTNNLKVLKRFGQPSTFSRYHSHKCCTFSCL